MAISLGNMKLLNYIFPIPILRNIKKSELQLLLFRHYKTDMVNLERKMYICIRWVILNFLLSNSMKRPLLKSNRLNCQSTEYIKCFTITKGSFLSLYNSLRVSQWDFYCSVPVYVNNFVVSNTTRTKLKIWNSCFKGFSSWSSNNHRTGYMLIPRTLSSSREMIR